MVFPVGFIDRQIVDRSETSLQPVAAVVMPLISKPHGTAAAMLRMGFNNSDL
jgi:hypothetical protein